MRELKITIENETVRAKLMEETAPGFIGTLAQYTPIEGKLNHAKVCDNEVFIQAPFFRDEKENPVFPVPGDLGYFPVRQTICFWFGPMKPLGPTTVFAKILPEDLPRFTSVAFRVWEKQGANLKLELTEV